MIYFRPWWLFYSTRYMCRLTNIYIRILVRREWVKAREQERKEIEALHRWEEAHIFEGGGIPQFYIIQPDHVFNYGP